MIRLMTLCFLVILNCIVIKLYPCCHRIYACDFICYIAVKLFIIYFNGVVPNNYSNLIKSYCDNGHFVEAWNAVSDKTDCLTYCCNDYILLETKHNPNWNQSHVLVSPLSVRAAFSSAGVDQWQNTATKSWTRANIMKKTKLKSPFSFYFAVIFYLMFQQRVFANHGFSGLQHLTSE